MESRNASFGIPSVSNLLIDSDMGVDDAGALIMALTQKDVPVAAITTVTGNCTSRQGVANVSRLQRLLETTVPVYLGASEPLINNKNRHAAPFYHGHDGFGDVPNIYPQLVDDDFQNYVKEEHAALAMIRLAKEHKGALTLVSLGPLTNVALAIKLDPEFCNSIRSLFLMGGNVYGVGNVHSGSTSEFNFQGDPEAAHIVLGELNCPIVIAPWELYSNIFSDNSVTRPLDRHLYLDTKISKFLCGVTGIGHNWLEAQKLHYAFCDEMAMAAALNKDTVKKCLVKPGTVELHGKYTRGQIAVDWMSKDETAKKFTFIKEYDAELVEEMMITAVNSNVHL